MSGGLREGREGGDAAQETLTCIGDVRAGRAVSFYSTGCQSQGKRLCRADALTMTLHAKDDLARKTS